MGKYNPHLPQDLGQEWVPIRDEDLVFSQDQNTFEVGSAFTLTSSKVLSTGRFYIHEFPEAFFKEQIFNISIYPKGAEDDAGPIQRVVIPCNNGGITGAGATFGSPATTVAQALMDPSDRASIIFDPDVSTCDLSMFFAVNSFSAQLTGKRILAVNFLYAGEPNLPDLTIGQVATDFLLSVQPDSSTTKYNFLPASSPVDGTGGLFGTTYIPRQVNRVRLGDTDLFFSGSPDTISDTMPWTYPALQKFEASASNRWNVHVQTLVTGANIATAFIDYAALEVLYCEERRVATGSRMFSVPRSSVAPMSTVSYYLMGTNPVVMRTMAGIANPVLAPGDYTVTICQGNTGDSSSAQADIGVEPLLNANRELYQIPPHTGIRVNIPAPLDDTAVNKVITSEASVILPQLTLHTSGGPITDLHVYGRQAVAQVYGSITATQEILDSGVTSSSFPWVRFYARRFGDTTTPLRVSSTSPTVSGTGMQVQITPPEFDALPEIIDGWKEITLRFPTSPSMGGGFNPQWTFSATSEFSGNRWEVLGASAPALSGIPGNLFNLWPALDQLGSATYGAPNSGSTINLGWLSPQVTVTTDDTTSDAVIIFGQDMPAVTGFSVVAANQAVSGIGRNCGIDPCCIPTAINYNALSWSPPNIVLVDHFTRTTSSSWGSLPTGQAWTTSGGAASDYSTNGSQGLIAPTSSVRRNVNLTGATVTDTDQTFTVTLTGSDFTGTEIYAYLRFTDTANTYIFRGVLNSVGAFTAELIRVLGGSALFLTSPIPTPITLTSGHVLKIRFQIEGFALRGKMWDSTVGDEPDDWFVAAYDTTSGLSSGTSAVGFATSATGLVAAFDEYVVTPLWLVGSRYQLERSDTVEPDWHVIMDATNLATTSFKDFEARVGIATSYRMRTLDAQDFPGTYSSTVTITSTAPGVTGGCISQGHVLIFSSNSKQDGSVNLAYSSVWMDGRVEEDFNFPEANFVQLQAMYNEDFFTAFRPLERGGEQFTRTVLVQAAAIAPETLADFTGLRDMAWSDVPYICVRDEDGNRWFANVGVPQGRVLRDRRLYLATVNIIEVTDTPSQVNP